MILAGIKLFTLFRATLILTVVSTCMGCGVKNISTIMGDSDNTEPPSPLVEFIETAETNKLWSYDVGNGTNELFLKLVPAVLDNRIFVADADGNIAAIDVTTGNVVWKKASKLPITGGLGVNANLVMAGTSEGDVLSLSTETGDEVWRSKVSSEILSSPTESENIVVVRTIDGKIFAFDVITGERLWTYNRTVPALTLRGTSTLVINNNRVIAGFDNGRVTVLELKTGKLIWESKVAISRGRSELERMVDIDMKPLIIDGVMYLTTFQANISALAIETGQILWQRDISSYSELGTDGNYIYVTDEYSNIWALDRFSGESVWKQEKLRARNITGPAILNNKVVVGDFEGYLHWMDKNTGDFVARIQASDSPILVKPIINNEVLFVYAIDGLLSAYTYFDQADKAISQKPDTEISEQSVTETDRKSLITVEKMDKQKKTQSIFGRFLDIFTGDNEEDEEKLE